MANYAVIKNNKVVNVIIADSKEIAEMVTSLECIEIEAVPGAPGTNWSYDGTSFIAPVTEEIIS